MSYELYAMAFCPKSRMIIWGLREHKVDFQTVETTVWDLDPHVKSATLGETLPILKNNDHYIACELAIAEYIEDLQRQKSSDESILELMGKNPHERAQVRLWLYHIAHAFHHDVTVNLLYEKVFFRQFSKSHRVDPRTTRQGSKNLSAYCKDLDHHFHQHTFLAKTQGLSWADLALASQMSCLDYLGEIKWTIYPYFKEWYVRLKSRPAFQPFLSESLSCVPASTHYPLLDF